MSRLQDQTNEDRATRQLMLGLYKLTAMAAEHVGDNTTLIAMNKMKPVTDWDVHTFYNHVVSNPWPLLDDYR